MHRARVTAVLLALTLAACGKEAGNETAATDDEASGIEQDACIDLDGDDHGQGCKSGPDCDDGDDTLTTECTCSDVREGCVCEDGTEPVECKLSQAQLSASTLLCKTGVRYCRDGLWTACIGIANFE